MARYRAYFRAASATDDYLPRVSATESQFEQIWVPRIGDAAAAQLRRSSYLGLVALPVVFGLAIACSFAFGSATAGGIVLGAAMASLAVGLFWAWIRSRSRVAGLMSERFGVHLGFNDLPKMRAASFDAWQRKRGLTVHRG